MTTTTEDGGGAGARGRRTFDSISDRLQSIVSSARSKVDDVRNDRTKRELYADLGEVYYRAVTAGHDGPDAGERDPIIDSIRALDDDTSRTDHDDD